MLRIERASNKKVILTLSGEITTEDVAELGRLIDMEGHGHHLVLDLKNVSFVDRNAVAFLGRCADAGIALENCPAYVRDWITQKERKERRPS